MYLSSGLFGRPIHGLIDSYLPPLIGGAKNNNDLKQEHFAWINNLQDGLSEANKVNKPVFIDFTGYTCTNCRWMETNIFVEPEVQSLFNEFVLVQLFTDGGLNHRENQKMEIDRFGTSALPFYVVLSPENEELARFHGMDPDMNKFIGFLNNSLNSHKAKGI